MTSVALRRSPALSGAVTGCCCGLNTIANLPVPPADKTDGAAVNVSGLQGVKTFEISGSYSGTYSILGSHDGNLYFPVAFFNSGGSSQTVRKTLEVVANFLKVHREAPQSGLVTVNIAARATTACASSTQGGLNNFFTLATLLPGANGPQPALDLFALVAATGMDVSNVACGGSFTGQISVEGSLDGVNFSPLGGFLSSQAQRGSGPGQSMFDPIVVGQVIRYIRANVLPSTVISTPTSLTMGGPQNLHLPRRRGWVRAGRAAHRRNIRIFHADRCERDSDHPWDRTLQLLMHGRRPRPVGRDRRFSVRGRGGNFRLPRLRHLHRHGRTARGEPVLNHLA
jgi:hypothetical protein